MWSSRFPLPSTLVLAAAAIWLLAKTLWVEPELIVAPAIASVSAEATQITGVSVAPKIDLSLYEATLARPLFTHDRQPIPLPVETRSAVKTAQPEPTVKQLSVDHIQLTGLIKNSTSARAFLEVDGKGSWIPLEAFIDGWQVIDIANNKVVLRKEGKTKEKYLYAP